MESGEFKRFIGKIPGLCSEDDCFVLYTLAKGLKLKADILEIGGFKGRVSIALALGLQDTGQPDKVYVIEANLFNTKKDLLNNIARFGVEDSVIPIFKHSSSESKIWTRPLKLIWIDTGGNYFSYKCDFLLWEPHLLKGGIVAFGSANSEDIKRFVKDCIVGSKRFKKIETIGPIVFAYKDKDTPTYIPWKVGYIRILYSFNYLIKKTSYILRDIIFFSWLRKSSPKRIINLFFEKLLGK